LAEYEFVAEMEMERSRREDIAARKLLKIGRRLPWQSLKRGNSENYLSN